MDENNTLDIVVIKYLDNEMSPEEKITFEERLFTDPLLNSRLERFRLAKEAVKYHGIHQQVTGVRAIWEEKNAAGKMVVTSKLTSVRTMARYALAAAAVLLVFFLIRGLSGSSYSADNIYQDTYIGYQLSNPRSQNNGLNKLEAAYQQDKFQEVVSLGKQDALSQKDQLLLAIAFLKLNDSPSAITTLQALEQSKDHTYQQDAAFYLGLAYLKNKNYDKALVLFTRINKDASHLYHKQVTDKTLRNLESLL